VPVEVAATGAGDTDGVATGVEVVITLATRASLVDQAEPVNIVGNQRAAAVVGSDHVAQAGRVDQVIGLRAVDVGGGHETERAVLERRDDTVRRCDRYQLVQVIVVVNGRVAGVGHRVQVAVGVVGVGGRADLRGLVVGVAGIAGRSAIVDDL